MKRLMTNIVGDDEAHDDRADHSGKSGERVRETHEVASELQQDFVSNLLCCSPNLRCKVEMIDAKASPRETAEADGETHEEYEEGRGRRERCQQKEERL